MSATAIALPVHATDASAGPVDKVAEATKPKDETNESLLKLSNEGFQAMRGIRAARIAIFNGQTDVAAKMLTEAKDSLDLAVKNAPDFAIKSQVSIGGKVVNTSNDDGKVDLVPVDAELMVADNYIDSPEKQSHIATANEHIKNGDHKKALEELKLGNIDVSYMRVLMPLQATQKHVDDAITMMNEKKFYEANLVLKAAEAGYQYDTIVLEGQPATTTGNGDTADSAKAASDNAKTSAQ